MAEVKNEAGKQSSAKRKKLSKEDIKARFQVMNRVEIVSYEEEQTSTPNSEGKYDTLLTVKLASNVEKKAHGNRMVAGKPLIAKGDTVYIVGDDVNEFLDNIFEEEDDKGNVRTFYEGKLKWDVSQPKTRRNAATGQYEIVQPPKLWLKSVTFDKSGQVLVANGRKESEKVIADFLGSLGNVVNALNVTTEE